MEYKEQYTFSDLMEIVEILRGENGCEWDKAQTHESLLRYLIEESYEYIEATRKKDEKSGSSFFGDDSYRRCGCRYWLLEINR